MRYNRISIVLDELDIGQKDLAELLEVTVDTVSRWCRNQNQPRIPELFKIASMLRVEVSRLLENPKWPETGISPIEAYKIEKEKKQKASTAKSKPKRKKRF